MTLQSNVFVSFQKITFKSGSFTDFKAFFPAMLTVYRSLVLVKMLKTTMEGSIRAIYVWPCDENARTIQKQQKNGNRANWLVYRIDTNAGGFWLVKETLGRKNLHAWELTGNQPILCCDVTLQHDWPIKQCPLHIRVFFGGKMKRPCFDLFIHWLLKQITYTYWNHFSRSYENRLTVSNSHHFFLTLTYL